MLVHYIFFICNFYTVEFTLFFFHYITSIILLGPENRK